MDILLSILKEADKGTSYIFPASLECNGRHKSRTLSSIAASRQLQKNVIRVENVELHCYFFADVNKVGLQKMFQRFLKQEILLRRFSLASPFKVMM